MALAYQTSVYPEPFGSLAFERRDCKSTGAGILRRSSRPGGVVSSSIGEYDPWTMQNLRPIYRAANANPLAWLQAYS